MNYKCEVKTTENEHGIIVEGRLTPQPTDKELLLMAYLIRAACIEKENCEDCVFGRGGVCDLSAPMEWIVRGNNHGRND